MNNHTHTNNQQSTITKPNVKTNKTQQQKRHPAHPSQSQAARTTTDTPSLEGIAEVRQPASPCQAQRSHHDVCRFEVGMHQPNPVQEGQGIVEVGRHRADLSHRGPSLHHLIKRTPPMLEYKMHLCAKLKGIQQLHHMRVSTEPIKNDRLSHDCF